MPRPIIHNFFENGSWKMRDCQVFNKKICKTEFLKFDQNLRVFGFFWSFFLKIVFFKIFPQKSYEWMLFQLKKLEKIRLVWLRVILIKRPLKTRNSSFGVKCPFYHVKGPLFSLLIDFFHWFIIFSEKKVHLSHEKMAISTLGGPHGKSFKRECSRYARYLRF